MDATDLCFTPATELATMIRRRQLSPVEIMDAVLARLETLNPRLNAYLAVDAERAREQARAAAFHERALRDAERRRSVGETLPVSRCSSARVVPANPWTRCVSSAIDRQERWATPWRWRRHDAAQR